MFKRLRWISVGALGGAVATLWAQYRLRRQVERYLPARMRAGLSARVRAAGSDLREALQEGRDAMADREAELRAQLGPPAGAVDGAGRPSLRVVGDPRPPRTPSTPPAPRSPRRRRP